MVCYKQNLPFLYFPVWIERFFIRPTTTSEDKKSLNPDGVLKRFSLITGYYVNTAMGVVARKTYFLYESFSSGWRRASGKKKAGIGAAGDGKDFKFNPDAFLEAALSDMKDILRKDPNLKLDLGNTD
jgi:hypothetical protein